MKLKTKITAGYLALLLLVVTLGGYAFYSVWRLETSSRNILKANFYSVELGAQMLQALDLLQASPTNAQGLAQFQIGLSREAANVTETGEQQLVDDLAVTFAAYRQRATAPQLNHLRATTYRMISLNTKALIRKNEQATQAATQTRHYLLAFLTLTVLIALLLVLSVPEATVAPLCKLTQSLEHATKQDFTVTIPIESNDEFGHVALAFNKMLVELKEFRASTAADLVTERNRARSIVNGLDEGLLLLDENRRIIMANPMLCNLLSLPAPQLLNRPAAEVAQENDLLRTLLSLLDAPHREQALAAAPLFNIPQKGEEAFYRLAAQDIVSFNEISDKTEFVGHILTLRNVSDFKKLDQVKSNFLATVSHELKTPLASINMSLRVLADERVAPDERQQVLDGIKRETQRLLRIVGELLDVSRLDMGEGIQLNFVATALPAVIQFAASTVQPQLDHKRVTLVQELPDDLPPVRADVEKTTWVLINLLANAIRYSPAGEPLLMRARRAGKFVQVTVQDRGPGIGAENHEKIFQRFTQIPDKSGYKGGSGLGLSIAREFITSQGGRLWVESELGNGSAFSFTLPITE